MKVSKVGGHIHTWNPGDKRTSEDDGHDHKVSNPSSGYTDPGGMDDHRHKIPSVKIKKKK